MDLDRKDKEMEILKKRQQKKVGEMEKQLKQKSVEVQGEIQEELLEDFLKRKFPEDHVEPINKGEKGGDCILSINNQTGTEYAKIFVGENHGLFLGEQVKKSELHIGEENTAFTGRLASNCVFRSPNKHSLDLLKADPKKGNKFYLLNNGKATEYFPKKIKD